MPECSYNATPTAMPMESSAVKTLLHLRLLGAAIFSLLAFSALGADETIPVPKPEVKVGDRWTYRHTDYWTNVTQSTYEHRITLVEPSVILGVLTAKGREGESDAAWTSDLNTMATGGGLVITPHTGFFRFPLKVGASHETTYETANRTSPVRSKYVVTMKVVGWEEITVPAGKFRALKIEGNGNFTRLDQNFGGWARFGFWYVPEVKRWVKYTYEDGSNRPYAKDGHELVEFSIQ